MSVIICPRPSIRYRYALVDSKKLVDRFSIIVISFQPHFSSIKEAAKPTGPPPMITADFDFTAFRMLVLSTVDLTPEDMLNAWHDVSDTVIMITPINLLITCKPLPNPRCMMARFASDLNEALLLFSLSVCVT